MKSTHTPGMKCKKEFRAPHSILKTSVEDFSYDRL